MIRPPHSSTFVLVACAFAFACSNDDATPAQEQEQEQNGEDAATPEDLYLGLATPEEGAGFQIRSNGTTIHPTEDVEYCEVAELPGSPNETYFVNRIEFGNGESSHHLIINVAMPGTAAEAALADLEIGHTVPCLQSDIAFGQGFEFTGGTQVPYNEVAFPSGVGRRYHGGQRFVFDYHYLNTTSGDVQARSAVNFHLVEEAEVEHIAKVFGFYNFTIDTPPGESASFTGECQFKKDVMVPGITRHTHRWGTDFSVWFSGGPNDGEHVWTSSHYEDDVDFPFEEPRLMHAGEGFKFECQFDNPEEEPLRFGPNATDEMCILFGLEWGTGEETWDPLETQDCQILSIGEDGVGHEFAEGEQTPPTPAEIAECSARPSPSGSTEACSTCGCESCANSVLACSNDEHCSAIFQCIMEAGCGDQDSCVQACNQVISDHSPGTGLLIAMTTCIQTSCASSCGFGDAGAP